MARSINDVSCHMLDNLCENPGFAFISFPRGCTPSRPSIFFYGGWGGREREALSPSAEKVDKNTVFDRLSYGIFVRKGVTI